MPTRPALTTRQRTTSTVASDNLNKGSELTFAEADSNFINLRDGTFGLVGDDSSGVDVRDGQTITVTGTGGITVAVANDTVTIDGSAVSGGGGDLGNLEVTDTTLSPISTNDDLTLEANGTGQVIVFDNLYVTSEGRTGNQLGDLLRVKPAGSGGVSINHEGSYNGTIFEVAGSQGQDANYRRPFEIKSENGTGTGGSPGNTDGRVYINGIKFPLGPGTDGQVLTTNGTDEYSWTNLNSLIDLITIVGDDSTGTVVNTGETFKFAGTQNITTAVSGDTLTITGPDLSNYIQNTSRAFAIVGDDSTGTDFNYGETVKIAGGTNITTAISGDTLTITGQSLFNTIAVNGQNSIVADSGTDTLTVAAGSGITLTTDSGTDTLTIAGSTNLGSNTIATPTNSPRSITPDLNNGGIQRCVLGNQPADQDCRLNAPTNMTAGDRLYLTIKGDYTGSHNISIYGMFNPSGVNGITVSDNKHRLFSIYYTGTEYICDYSAELTSGS